MNHDFNLAMGLAIPQFQIHPDATMNQEPAEMKGKGLVIQLARPHQQLHWKTLVTLTGSVYSVGRFNRFTIGFAKPENIFRLTNQQTYSFEVQLHNVIQ